MEMERKDDIHGAQATGTEFSRGAKTARKAMISVQPDQLRDVVTFLREERKADVSLDDVMRLTEILTRSMGPMLQKLDTGISNELNEMAGEIAHMKADVAALQFGKMRDDRIPTAGRELEAVVEATEQATNRIMTAAEAIMSIDPDDIEKFQVMVGEQVVEIFEACTFQDITGQRISKVVKTLGHIEERINTLIHRLKLVDVEGADHETEDERRARELILHGPQHSGEGVNQADIDALFP